MTHDLVNLAALVVFIALALATWIADRRLSTLHNRSRHPGEAPRAYVPSLRERTALAYRRSGDPAVERWRRIMWALTLMTAIAFGVLYLVGGNSGY